MVGDYVILMCCLYVLSFFFFQAEDGIRDAQESRGLGDVYKRQLIDGDRLLAAAEPGLGLAATGLAPLIHFDVADQALSLIHI